MDHVNVVPLKPMPFILVDPPVPDQAHLYSICTPEPIIMLRFLVSRHSLALKLTVRPHLSTIFSPLLSL